MAGGGVGVTVRGAVRFGDGASIGAGHWLPAHGGAIETVLDEATAEAAKVGVSHMVSTTEISVRIGRPVPLHASLEVRAAVASVRGARVVVDGAIADPASGEELATCVAVLADLVALRAAKMLAG